MKPQRFRAGKKFVEIGVLREKPDFAAGGDDGVVAPENGDTSPRRGDEAENDLQSGTLSRPVGAEQAIDFAWCNLQVQIAQCHGYPAAKGRRIYLCDVGDADGSVHHARISKPRAFGGSGKSISVCFLIKDRSSLARTASRNARSSSGSALTCISTRPSSRLRTQPVRLKPFAICLTE